MNYGSHMGKLIALIIGFLVMTFWLVTTVIAQRTGGSTVNPAQQFGRQISGVLNNADKLAPDLSVAIGRMEDALPKIDGGRRDKSGPAFVAVDLSGQDLTSANRAHAAYAASLLNGTIFLGALLDDASFEGATGAAPNFRRARLARADLNGAILQQADFSDVLAPGMTARAAILAASTFERSDITGARFSAADLDNSVFRGAYAAGATFIGASVRQADFTDADLRAARFAGADLSGTVFSGADIAGADLAGARLSGADFSGAEGATSEQFANACGDAATKLPASITLATCL